MKNLSWNVIVGFGVAFLSLFPGCSTKGCPERDIPSAWQSMQEIVPAESTICGQVDGDFRIFLKNAKQPSDGYSIFLAHAESKGWSPARSVMEGKPTVWLSKGNTKIVVSFFSYRDDVFAVLAFDDQP